MLDEKPRDEKMWDENLRDENLQTKKITTKIRRTKIGPDTRGSSETQGVEVIQGPEVTGWGPALYFFRGFPDCSS